MVDNGTGRLRIVEEYAAKRVAGSTFRIMVDGLTCLHECGFRYSRTKEEGFPFDAKEVHSVGMGHAHVDHIGRFMELMQRGFNGKVYATPITVALANLQFNQEATERFFYNKRIKGKRIPGSWDFVPWKEFPKKEHVLAAMDMFAEFGGRKGVPYRKEVEIAPGISIKFYEAGHIPGSALTMYKINKDGLKMNLLLAYDLGRTDYKIAGHPICDTPFLRFPDTNFDEEADYVVVEATYGNREHKPLEQSLGSLEEAIKEVERTKGVLFAPAFSIMRTQMLREFLFRFDKEGKLPKDMMIYTSSPGADDVDKIMMANFMEMDEEAIRELKTPKHSSFYWDKYIRHKKLDETITTIKERMGNAPSIIIASSGMCDMGRAVPLSREIIGDERNVVLKLGYASQGSRMDLMARGEKKIPYEEGDVEMKAKVMQAGGFSGHADGPEIYAFIENVNKQRKGGKIKAIFVKHGEESSCSALAQRISSLSEKVIVMEPGQGYAH